MSSQSSVFVDHLCHGGRGRRVAAGFTHSRIHAFIRLLQSRARHASSGPFAREFALDAVDVTRARARGRARRGDATVDADERDASARGDASETRARERRDARIGRAGTRS